MLTVNKKELFLKRFLYVCAAIYVLTLAAGFYMNFVKKDYEALGMTLVACITPLIVPIGFKLLKLKPVYEIYIISTIFVYFASLIGSGFGWYSYFGFDKVLHFTSGWFVTTLAVILYFAIRKTNAFEEKKYFTLFLVFINAVNIAVAELWEFYEYAMLIFFNNDCINHYSQGVHDTITDCLCATFAGILLTIMIVRYYKSGKSNFFVNVYEKFYVRNIEKKDV
ncbi:hypothetical protein [Amedibacterium intestinale]|nr:hypothetical protein [Amedibacterium intestinale]RHO15867.1 hypothetical protein DW220_12945 [Eubacterium sp. AM18-26]RHO21067.1 hypothetical protein DW212_13065 [Eubacterium sp. AM18-10LB-B]